MLKQTINFHQEDFLTGFLHALAYLTEILFFYGTGVVMYGFWQGITGGYLTLSASMVISGSILFHLLVQVLGKDRQEREEARQTAWLMEAGLLSVLAFGMEIRTGAVILSVCGITFVLERLWKGKGRRIVLSFCRFLPGMAGLFLVTALFGQKTITLADCFALLGGLACIDFPTDGEKSETSEAKKVLPLVLTAGRNLCFLCAWGELAPVFYAMVNQKGNSGMPDLKKVVVFGVAALVLSLFLQGKENRWKKEREWAALSLSVLAASGFLLWFSPATGLVYLLCFAALSALLFLMHSSGHEEKHVLDMICYVGTHLGLILTMVTVFQVYNGISVNYRIVLLAYFLESGLLVLMQEMRKS